MHRYNRFNKIYERIAKKYVSVNKKVKGVWGISFDHFMEGYYYILSKISKKELRDLHDTKVAGKRCFVYVGVDA